MTDTPPPDTSMTGDADLGLVFVDELPGKPTGHSKTRMRAEAIKARPNTWCKWPSKTAAAGLRKSLGEGFVVEVRGGQAFVKWIAVAGGNPPAGRLRQAQCAYCHAILGEAVDPEELIEIHRANKAVCDRRYKRDGL